MSFSIDAIVVLPAHLHAILTLPPNDADFSGRWRRIKGRFSNELIRAGQALAKWRSRALAEAILGARHPRRHDFSRHVDYIHFNPVKHGLAPCVRDWPYSSFHRSVREGILPDDWAGDVNETGMDFGEPRDMP